MNLITKKLIFRILFTISFFPIFWAIKIPNYGSIDSSNIEDYAVFLSRIIGLMGLVILFWQFLLGYREFIAKWIPDLVYIKEVHKLLGIYGFLFILLHPLLMVLYFGDRGLGLLIPNLDSNINMYLTYGRISFYAFALIWFVSAIVRGKIKYRPWKQIHFLTYLILPFGLLHARNAGSLIRDDFLRPYFDLMLIIFVVLTIYRFLRLYGIGKNKYKLIRKEKITKDVFKLTFKPIKKSLKPNNGEFIYIQTKQFGEEHPFTVSHYDEEKNELSLSVKASGKFSESIHMIPIGNYVFIDGPFGVFTKEAYSLSKPIVLVAGGIGITPFLRFIEEMKKNRKPKDNPFYLFYGNKTMEDIAYKDYLEKEIKSPNKLVHIMSKEENLTDPKMEMGYCDVELMEKYLPGKVTDYIYFICGPKPMMDSVSKDLKSHGVKKSSIFMENFSF